MKFKLKIKIKSKLFYMKPKIHNNGTITTNKIIGQLKPLKTLSKVALYS